MKNDITNPRKTTKEIDAIKGQLLSYYGTYDNVIGPEVIAHCPKELLFAAADALGSLQFDKVELEHRLRDAERLINSLYTTLIDF